MNGWIVLDKPLGLSSAQAVAAVKRIGRQSGAPRFKVGHGGTLDPLATGVLPIALGEATKLAGRMLNGDKAYDFTIRFGEATDTDDAEGAVVGTSPVRPTLAEVEAVLPRFTGRIRQRPPAFSALKVDGERAYRLARAGAAVELAEREVVIHALKLCSDNGLRQAQPRQMVETATYAPPDTCPEPVEGPAPEPVEGPAPEPVEGPAAPAGAEPRLDELALSVRCSKGTYVRSLARDIAEALGTLGHVVMLRRSRVGPFGLDAAISLDNLQKLAMERGLAAAVLPLTTGLDDIPALAVDPGEAERLRQGQQLAGRPEPDGSYVAIADTVPIALVAVDGGRVRVERGFNL